MESLSKRMQQQFGRLKRKAEKTKPPRVTATQREAAKEALAQEELLRDSLGLPPKKRDKKFYGDLAERQWVRDLIGSEHGVTGDLWDDPYGVSAAPKKTWSTGPSKPPVGILRVVHADGGPIMERAVSSYDQDWWDVAAAVYPPVDGVMEIPEASVSWKEGTVAFNPCTFDATTSYMQSAWGRKLDDYDKDYAKYHPLATDGGIPQEYTATVIQGMIEPYGFRISRIRIRAGSLASGEETSKWIRALGCNPYAMIDHTTTNEQAIQRMRDEGFPAESIPTLEEANRRWRLEFHDEPLRPSIIGMAGYQSSGVATGAGMGHATYLSPRGTYGNWKLSIQLAPTEQVRYMKDPEMPAYVRRRGRLDFGLQDVKRPDGSTLAVMVGGKYHPAGSGLLPALPKSEPPPEELPAEGLEPNTEIERLGVDKGQCVSCNEIFDLDEMVDGMLVCHDCYAQIWEDYKCPKCNMRFSRVPPDFDAIYNADPERPEFVCPNPACDEDISLPGNTPELETVQRGIVAYIERADADWEGRTP